MHKPEPVPLPDQLRGVPRSVLEEYISARIRQFSRVFGKCLTPDAPEAAFETAFASTLQFLGASEASNLDNCVVRFRHRCRFLGCANKECVLCKNNPNKRCMDDDNFDECYADCQLLRSKCEADIYLEVTNSLTGLQQTVPGLELQVCVVDGESWSESSASVTSNVRRLLKSDEGDCLLASTVSGTKTDAEGYLYLKLQEGQVRLPDINVTDKNDTFHMHGESYSTFRIMAQAIKRDLFGKAVPITAIPPAISGKFIVKTQRALNDYRKSEYPHYKDELTKLKFIGSITAQRLREIQTHLGFDVPFTSIETVEQLKHLMLYADQNRQVESKLLELLNMKGKHKQKWDYLREILNEKIVYDDMLHRAWYADEMLSQGLLFTCKQGQVNLDKPVGMFRRLQQGSQACLQVFTHADPSTGEVVQAWKAAAEQAWCMPGHGQWAVVQERLELVPGGPGPLLLSSAPGSLHGHQLSDTNLSPAMSAQDPMDDAQVMYMRHSPVSSPHSHSDTPTDHRMTQQHSGASGMMAMDGGQPQNSQAAQGHMSYAFHTASPPGGSFQDAHRSMGINPAVMGPFQFASAPTTQGSGHVTPNSELGDMYQRASSAQTLHHVSGRGSLQTRLSTGSQDNSERSSRYRRMSADAMSQQAAAQHALAMQRSAADPYQQQPQYADMGLLKRPRSSAPSGLYSTEDIAFHATLDSGALERARVSVYHSESHGRHLPRGRKSQENLCLNSLDPHGLHDPHNMHSPNSIHEPHNITAAVFDTHELDIEHLLQGIDGPGPYGIKSEDGRSSDPMLLNLQLQQIQMGPIQQQQQQLQQQQSQQQHLTLLGHPMNTSSGGASALQGGQQRALPQMAVQAPPKDSWKHQELSAGIQHTLNLAEPTPPHHLQQLQQLQMQQQLQQRQSQLQLSQMQQQQQQQMNMHGLMTSGGLERQPMMMGTEADSFKSLNRLLKHSDSDSFKHLLSSQQLGQSFGALQPGQQSDPSFDKALQDIIQGRQSSGNM